MVSYAGDTRTAEKADTCCADNANSAKALVAAVIKPIELYCFIILCILLSTDAAAAAQSRLLDSTHESSVLPALASLPRRTAACRTSRVVLIVIVMSISSRR